MITKTFFKYWIKCILKNNIAITWNTIQITLSKNLYLSSHYHKCNYNKVKGDLFEHLIKYAFQKNNRNRTVYLYNEIPLTLKNKLNLPPTDKGLKTVSDKEQR